MTTGTFFHELWRALTRQSPAFEPRMSGDGEPGSLRALVAAVTRSTPAFTGVSRVSADSTGAVLSEANTDDDLVRSIRSGAVNLHTDLSGADLSHAELRGATLMGADLSGANLSRADLSLANLMGARLVGAKLSSARLSSADLSHADLSHADLSSADLMGARLIGADLNGALLIGANLNGAFLSGANLSGAWLGGADLSGAILSEALLAGARWGPRTVWPTAAFAAEVRDRSDETSAGVFEVRGDTGRSSPVSATSR
jgi:uncharacterized protein YjbI with pentapeptide repeats